MDQLPPADTLTDAMPPPASRADVAACFPQGDSWADGESDAAWEQRVLKRLADIGLNLAERVETQAVEANWLGVDGPAMFDRLALTVRRCIALRHHLKTDHPATALASKPPGPPGPPPSSPPPSQEPDDSGASERSDAEPRGRLLADLNERLQEKWVETQLAKRPVDEIVGILCESLGVTTDPPPEPPLAWVPPPPEIRSSTLGVVMAGDLVLGAAAPGLPDSALPAARAGRGPPRR